MVGFLRGEQPAAEHGEEVQQGALLQSCRLTATASDHVPVSPGPLASADSGTAPGLSEAVGVVTHAEEGPLTKLEPTSVAQTALQRGLRR